MNTDIHTTPTPAPTTLSERMAHARAALQNNRGMTLVEVLIVLTIMASIMGVVGFVAVGALDKAGKKEAVVEMGTLGQGVEQFYIMNGRTYPQSLDELVKDNTIKKVPKDPWNQDYVYVVNDKSFELSSKGPDGIDGNEDDIKYEQ